MKYWCVYALILHGGHELEASGLWNYLFGATYFHLLLVIYLQLPYFRGAIKGHAFILKVLSYVVMLLLGTATSSATSSPSPKAAELSWDEKANSEEPTTTVSGVRGGGSSTAGNSAGGADSSNNLRNRQRSRVKQSSSLKEDEIVPSAAAAIQAEFISNDEEIKKNN